MVGHAFVRGQAVGAGQSLGAHRTSSASARAEAAGRKAARLRSRRARRDPLRAQDRHPLGVPAARGRVQRHDLLAAPSGLARGRRLAAAASRPAQRAGRRRQDRLGTRFAGCHVGSSKKGGAETGPNPTDRGRPGTKYHVLVEKQGIPLVAEITAANVHDGRLFNQILDAVPPIRRPRGRPRRRPEKIHADKGYDDRVLRMAARLRGIVPRIARKGVESKQRLGRHRWVVERTIAWIRRNRRLTVRYERRADIHRGFLNLAVCLICLSYL
jgi:transposase